MENFIKSEAKEAEPQKSTSMPFNYYYSDYSKGFAGFSLHWHDEIEIFYIIKGKGDFLIDDEEYIVNEGDIVYVSPGLIHSGQAMDKNNLITSCYVFNPSYLMSGNSEYNTDKYVSCLHNTPINTTIIKPKNRNYAKLKNCLMNINNCISNKEIAYQLEIRANMLMFFSLLYKSNYLPINEHNSQDLTDTEDLIKKAINYIQSHFDQPLTIEQIAKHVGLSPSYFMNVFKNFTKMTCVTYINSFRLNIAESMLKETNASVLEISQACGFNNLSLFNREFKKLYFSTPTQYRKDFKGEAEKAKEKYGYSSELTLIVKKKHQQKENN